MTSLGCVALHSLPWGEGHVRISTTPRYLALYGIFVANGSWGGCVGVNCGGSHAPTSPLSVLWRYLAVLCPSPLPLRRRSRSSRSVPHGVNSNGTANSLFGRLRHEGENSIDLNYIPRVHSDVTWLCCSLYSLPWGKGHVQISTMPQGSYFVIWLSRACPCLATVVCGSPLYWVMCVHLFLECAMTLFVCPQAT